MMCRLPNRSVFGDDYLDFMLCGVVAPELRNTVARGLAPLAALGFLQKISRSLTRDVKHHVEGVGRLRVIANDVNGVLQPVAFIASDVKARGLGHFGRQTLYHLGGIIVDPEHQGKGLGKKLVRDELAQTRADLLGFHTQNAHMLRLGRKVSNYDFLLSYLLATEMGTKDPQVATVAAVPSVVEAGRYGEHSLYGDLGKFQQEGRVIPDLDYEHGDAIVYVGKVKK